MTPAKAQDGGTTAIANPVATSSGSVSNQAVQINQGSYSQQGYGNGHTCNSSTLVLTPFYLGNDVNNPEASYIRNQNFGAQISLSIPLDLEMVRLCKDLAKQKIEKERLDYELVRILKCVEIKKAGYTIYPSSPYAGVCADVIKVAQPVGHCRLVKRTNHPNPRSTFGSSAGSGSLPSSNVEGSISLSASSKYLISPVWQLDSIRMISPRT